MNISELRFPKFDGEWEIRNRVCYTVTTLKKQND